MQLENEIGNLNRRRRRGPLSLQQRWEIVQAAYQKGMKGADLCDLNYSLMSADEKGEADRIWGEIRPLDFTVLLEHGKDVPVVTAIQEGSTDLLSIQVVSRYRHTFDSFYGVIPTDRTDNWPSL